MLFIVKSLMRIWMTLITLTILLFSVKEMKKTYTNLGKIAASLN